MPPNDANALPPAEIAALLADARERTLLLIASVPEPDLYRQHSPLMGPLAWDLGHIAQFEDLWLIRNLQGPVEFGEMPGTFNPFENPRRVRGKLQLPPLREMYGMLAEVRARVLRTLAQPAPNGDDPHRAGGFVYRMVAQHEYQHGETMLQALQLKDDPPYTPPVAVQPPPGRPVASEADGMVRFPGGEVVIGTDDAAHAYDNERPAHRVSLAPFRIGAAPVTNGEYLRFMEDGGYADERLWSAEGWRWRTEEGATAPLFWRRRDGEWVVRTMDRIEPPDPLRPVCHVCWHEAEAYARWAGGRLPTEPEWEAAASWDPERNTGRGYPWGDDPPSPLHANLDQLAFATAQVGAYPLNVSPVGCYGMIGDVWEWTASTFGPWPGFRAFPYREYSEAFFGGEYRVLRGGSWATRPGAVRNTFRNWDYPVRRQIFSGFRIARDD